MVRYIALIFSFAILLAFLGIGLRLDPHNVPSPLINKPAPAFALSTLENPQKTILRSDMLGKVWILNVWASWCGACRDEHATLLDFSRTQPVAIYGLNYKDIPTNARLWLDRYGNPFVESLVDVDGRAGMDLGVYGVPETFVIDQQGNIRLKHVGPITPTILQEKIIPLLKELNG